MNGNRTWARQHRLLAYRGHEYGREKLKEVIRWSIEYGLECLTVFAFSTENWERPKVQVSALMRLLGLVLDDDVPALHREGGLRQGGRPWRWLMGRPSQSCA